MPTFRTLYQIRRVYRFVDIRCHYCTRGGTVAIGDAIGVHGAMAKPRDVARTVFAECPDLPGYLTNGKCRWKYEMVGPLTLSQGEDELHLVCGSPRINGQKKCGHRRHLDTRAIIRRYGDITIAEFLRRAKCSRSTCQFQGADLE